MTTAQNPASPDGETLHAKLQRLATWLEVAETNFGGLPEGVSLREVWVTMRNAALASAPRPDADAKLADLIKKLKLLASGHSIGLGRDWQITQVNAAITALLSATERAASLEHDLLIAHAAIIILKKAQAMKDRKLRKEAERGDTV